jgi:hypothetical protein
MVLKEAREVFQHGVVVKYVGEWRKQYKIPEGYGGACGFW